jgi:hypothetical protein
MLNHPSFATLSAHAVKLLIDVARLYDGKNNGDLSAAYSVLQRERHWKSRDTLGKAIGELCRAGFLERTRQGRKWGSGGTPEPNLYALTWRGIDASEKHALQSNVPSNRWRTPAPIQKASTPAVAETPKPTRPAGLRVVK